MRRTLIINNRLINWGGFKLKKMKTRNFIYGFLACLFLLSIVIVSGYFYLKSEREEMLLEENTKEVSSLSYSLIQLEENDLKNLNLIDNNNKTISFNNDRFVFINFWATWCMPCVAELPSIKKLQSEAEKENLPIQFVLATDDTHEKVEKFENKKQYGFNYSFFNKKNVPKTFVNDLIPATYILDKENGLCYKISGTTNYDSDIFKRFLKSVTK